MHSTCLSWFIKRKNYTLKLPIKMLYEWREKFISLYFFFVACQRSSILVKEVFIFILHPFKEKDFLTFFWQVPFLEKIKQQVEILMEKIDLKKVFAPSTIGVVWTIIFHCSYISVLLSKQSIHFSFYSACYEHFRLNNIPSQYY